MARLLSELLSGTAVGELHGDPATAVARLTFDSRAVQPGDCFFALRGTQTDGHAFIAGAVAAGAAAVVCENLPDEQPAGVAWVVVPDSHAAMADLAAAFYDHPSRALQLDRKSVV